MIVEDSHTREDWGVLTLQGTHNLLSRPYRISVEGLHFLVSFVPSPCDMFDMLGDWFLVSIELALVG